MDRYFEDYSVGDWFETDTIEITERAIVDFARQFDPQPFHLDAEAALKSPFKGLCASGWHTTALGMKLIVESGVMRATGILGVGVDELRWHQAVRPSDVLRVKMEVESLTPSTTNAQRGTMRVRLRMRNQNNELVFSQVAILLVPRRPK